MEISIIALPLIASIISGFFGKLIGDRNSEIITSLQGDETGELWSGGFVGRREVYGLEAAETAAASTGNREKVRRYAAVFTRRYDVQW